MKIRNFRMVLVILVAVVLPNLHARADIQQILAETERVEQTDGGFRLIWWIPTDYWREAFKKSTMTQAQSDAFCKSLDGYIVFAIADAKVGPIGGFSSLTRDQLLQTLTAKAGEGEEMKPLSLDQLSPDAKNFLDMMKPALTNMLGKFGGGLEFFCFPATDAGGARLIDPRKDGMLLLNYDGSVYKFRLPLGSLLPPKYDPQTAEKFPGNYIYSPFTGTKLVDSPPPQTH
jgi:hypothetical protein